MKRHEWEQDIVNRQRNIVFPDTMLNEARFYRNLANAKSLSTTQKIGCALISLVILWCGSWLVLQTCEGLMHSHGFMKLVSLGMLVVSTGIAFFGCMALFYCFASASTPKHHRKPKDLQHPDKF